jgi:hypothetical protein
MIGLSLLIILYKRNKTFRGEVLGWKEMVQKFMKKMAG